MEYYATVRLHVTTRDDESLELEYEGLATGDSIHEALVKVARGASAESLKRLGAAE